MGENYTIEELLAGIIIIIIIILLTSSITLKFLITLLDNLLSVAS